MRSELKWKPHENTACVFLTWTILQMEKDSGFKKRLSRGRREWDLIPPTGGCWGVVYITTPPDSMLIMYPLRLRGYMLLDAAVCPPHCSGPRHCIGSQSLQWVLHTAVGFPHWKDCSGAPHCIGSQTLQCVPHTAMGFPHCSEFLTHPPGQDKATLGQLEWFSYAPTGAG